MSSKLNVYPVPAFKDNYIWLIELETSSSKGTQAPPDGSTPHPVAIVDPGTAQPVLQAIEDHGFEPVAVLATHHHHDHIGGIPRLSQHYDIPVYGPATETIPRLTHPLREGDEVRLGTTEFRVLDIPGHTAGHIAFYGAGALFCGDTLFAAGCGRLFEGTAAQMYQSLSKLAGLPDDTQVYCGHEYTLNNVKFALQVEPENADLYKRLADIEKQREQGRPTVPAPLGLERQTNPFLRCNEPNVIAAAEKYAGTRLNGGEDTFAVVRHWKDISG